MPQRLFSSCLSVPLRRSDRLIRGKEEKSGIPSGNVGSIRQPPAGKANRSLKQLMNNYCIQLLMMKNVRLTALLPTPLFFLCLSLGIAPAGLIGSSYSYFFGFPRLRTAGEKDVRQSPIRRSTANLDRLFNRYTWVEKSAGVALRRKIPKSLTEPRAPVSMFRCLPRPDEPRLL